MAADGGFGSSAGDGAGGGNDDGDSGKPQCDQTCVADAAAERPPFDVRAGAWTSSTLAAQAIIQLEGMALRRTIAAHLRDARRVALAGGKTDADLPTLAKAAAVAADTLIAFEQGTAFPAKEELARIFVHYGRVTHTNLYGAFALYSATYEMSLEDVALG